MEEKSVPLLVDVDDVPNVSYLIRKRAEIAPDQVAYSVLRDKTYHDVTTTEFVADVLAVAKGLIAQGIQVGDHVAIMSATRYEWTVCDFATLFVGGVVVPIYETSSQDQVAFILRDSDTRLAFGETARHGKLLAAAVEANGGPLASGIWRMTGDVENSMDALRASGKDVSNEQVREREAQVRPDSVASLVYTSGTISDPRGAAVTHGNLAHLCVNTTEELNEIFYDGASTVLLLPLAHILARFVQLAVYWGGARTTHVRDASRIVPVLAAAEPTFMVVVPRVMSKVLAAVRKGAEEKKMGKVFDRAQKVAIAWGQHLERSNNGEASRVGLGLKLQHALFDKLFYSRIRQTMGGKLEYLVSGAAPLDAELGQFFMGVGIEVLQGYGLTETTAPITVNRPRRAKCESVGIPMPGSSVRISPDGEIQAKGLGVFAGYHHSDPAKDFTEDGWFPTGDLGQILPDGRLKITGRAKDMIITDSGKNISPQRWQGIVDRSPLVANAVVVGDKRPHPVALLVLDHEGVTEWAKANNRADLASKWDDKLPEVPGEVVTDEQLLAALQEVVAEANAGGNHAERINDFAAVMVDVSEEAGYTTPTMKLKRPKFIEHMAPVIEDLYRK